MNDELSEHDIDVLMMHDGKRPIKHGAYFNAVSEYLMNHGYLTQMPWELTTKGKEALQECHPMTPVDRFTSQKETV